MGKKRIAMDKFEEFRFSPPHCRLSPDKFPNGQLAKAILRGNSNRRGNRSLTGIRSGD
jgi:hypothetical protein